MSKLLLVAIVAVFSLSVHAQGDQPKHVISIGTDGFGWSGLSQVFNWDKDESGIKDHNVSEGSLKLNYSYVFETRVMLGAEIKSETSNSEIKAVDGSKTTDDTSDTQMGISLGYNFNEDLNRSWWVKGTLGSGKYKSETKDADGTSEFEFGYSYFTLSAGKRISLESWGLKNVSYNPSISFSSASVRGDAHDAGLDTATIAQLDIIKVDILF